MPMIFTISFFVGLQSFPYTEPWMKAIFVFLVMLNLGSLAMTAFSDPGILYRYKQPPAGTSDWRYSDQAETYRPRDARFVGDVSQI